MILLLALIPATALTMAGYLVLYVSRRSEGALSTFGRWLAFWAFTLAALVVLGGVFAAGHMHGEGPRGFWSRHHECPQPAAPPAGVPGADVSPQSPAPAPGGAK